MNKFLKIFPYLLLIIVGQVPSISLAQNQFNLSALEAGQLLLNINATETVEVDEDTLNVAMQYIAIGKDRVQLQDDVNSVMALALEILEDSTNVDYSIEQYQVYMIQADRDNDNNLEQQIWRAQQSLQLKSIDTEAILNLSRLLQENKLTMQNMYYSLSSAQFELVSESLLEAALIKLQGRANAAAESLQKSLAELVEVTVNGNDGRNFSYRGGAMSMAAESSIAGPVAQPGKTEVSLSVSARALLSK